MAKDIEPVSQGLRYLRPRVHPKFRTPGVKYKASDVAFPVVPVVDPKGRILFVSITANSANSKMVQFTQDGRPAIHPDFEGWSLLADFYDKEPDKYRREEGAKFVDEYIYAWKHHPSRENRAKGVQWNPPFSESGGGPTPVDHLLPIEVLNRRNGKSTPLGPPLQVPQQPKKAG